MSRVHTPLGVGTIKESTTLRGVTTHLVEGDYFSAWFKSADIFIEDVEHTPEVVDEENSTLLPYNPEPQTSVLPEESTLQPIYEIDEEERLEPTESLDVNQLLGSKYVKVPAPKKADRDSELGRLRNDPEQFAREIRSSYRLASIDESLVDSFYLMDSDPTFREAAWRDVRAKAVRLRTSGNVKPSSVTPRAIYATVQGDNGVYETVVVRGGATIGSGSITEWACSCPWGQHAFLRQHTYVGRLCSHAYAAYMELQSSTKIDYNRDIVRDRKRKKTPAKLPYQSSLNVEETSYFPKTHYCIEETLEDTREYADFDSSEDTYKVAHVVDEDTGFYAHYTQGEDGLLLGIYNPLDQLVEVVEPKDGESYDEGEDLEALESFLKTLSEGEAYGKTVEAGYEVESEGFRGEIVTDAQGDEVLEVYAPSGDSVGVLYCRDEYFEEGEAQRALDTFVSGLSDSERSFYSRVAGYEVERRHNGESEYICFLDEEGNEVDTAYPQNGVSFEPGEEEEAYQEFVKNSAFTPDVSREPFSGSGPRGPLRPSTSAERAEEEDVMYDVTEPGGISLRTAGRKFTFQEQMDLINEALGDDEVLGGLDLKGTHYVR